MNDKLKTAIIALADKFEERALGVHSFVLYHNGTEAAECFWRPYRAEFTHMLNSLSKSFTSVGALFAMQDGLLSPDDYVVDFFDKCEVCENMKKMKVRHLLSMSTGHRVCADFAFRTHDSVRAFLTSDVPDEPGTTFVYNTAATYMVSAIVGKVTGLPVYEYLEDKLFKPLGISGIRWESCEMGIPYGGFGLHVHTHDIAKFGQFLLNRGTWNGVRLLDEKLIDEATSKQIPNTGEKDWSMGYGWQFWRCVPDGVYRGDGAYGQYCLVMPKQNAVLAINSGGHDLQGILDEVWEILLPTLEGIEVEEVPLVLDREIKPLGGKVPSDAKFIGRYYQLLENRFGLVGFEFEACDRVAFTLRDGGKYAFAFGDGEWVDSVTGIDEGAAMPFRGQLLNDVSASGRYDDGTLELCVVGNHSGYIQTWSFRFELDRVTLHFKQNLSSGDFDILGCRSDNRKF